MIKHNAYLPPFSISPGDPAAAIAAVFNAVALGKLIAHAVSMATLGAHERDEVHCAQVDLQELLQGLMLCHHIWTPRPVTIVKVKPEGT